MFTDPNYKPLYKYVQTPMTKKESKAYLTITMMDESDISEMVKEMDELKTPILQILKNQIEMSGLCLSDRLTVFLYVTCATLGNPGFNNLYILTMLFIRRKESYPHDKPMCFNEVIPHHFCMGFPDERELSKAWDDSKRLNNPIS